MFFNRFINRTINQKPKQRNNVMCMMIVIEIEEDDDEVTRGTCTSKQKQQYCSWRQLIQGKVVVTVLFWHRGQNE